MSIVDKNHVEQLAEKILIAKMITGKRVYIEDCFQIAKDFVKYKNERENEK